MRPLRFLPPVIVGAVLGVALGWMITGDVNYAVAFGLTLGPGIMILTFLGWRRRGSLGSSDGGYAAGRVEWVRRVGATADGVQQADIRVSVFSRDDSPYQTTMRTLVDATAMRLLIPGAIVPLLRLGPRIRPDVSYAPDAPPEWQDQLTTLRAESAGLAPTADVKPWETATTTAPGTRRPGSTTRSRGLVVASAIVLVVAAVALIPAYSSIARGVNNLAQGRWDGSDMVTGLYQQESVDQMIAAAGTSRFTNLGFYPGFILGDALSGSNPGRTDEVRWQFGRSWVVGPSFIQSDELQRELFDAADLDISVVAQVARDGVERAAIEHPEFVYAFIRVGATSGDPEIRVSISGAYDDAYLSYGFDGELISAGGSAFE